MSSASLIIFLTQIILYYQPLTRIAEGRLLFWTKQNIFIAAITMYPKKFLSLSLPLTTQIHTTMITISDPFSYPTHINVHQIPTETPHL